MAKTGAYRDTQKHQVYAWENSGILANYWNNRITKEDVVKLCHKILSDTGNSFRISNFKIKFDVRNGGAWGGYHGVRFTPRNLSEIIVIHEMAHALSITRCKAGHDAQYVACYMALLEKYLGINIMDLAKSLREPVSKIQEVLIPTTPVGQVYDARQGLYKFQNIFLVKREIKTMKPPAFDPHELRKWRDILNKGTVSV